MQKPYTLPLKYNQWVCEELEMLEKAGIISLGNLSGPNFIVPNKAQPEDLPQKCLSLDHHALNSSLPPVVKAKSKLKVFFS